MIWQLQDAKNKFSQVVNNAVGSGPQIVTRHGKEIVVVLSFEEYKLMARPKPNLLDLLMDEAFFGSKLEVERDAEDFGREIAL